MKKVLILTVSTGQGHNSTAMALHTAIKSHGADARTLDVCYYINKFLGLVVSKGYLLSVDALSGSYASTYSKLENRNANPNSAIFKLCSLFAPKLNEYISDYNPDVIVCTHVFAALSVVTLKRKGLIRAKTVGIITDFTVHPYWEDVTDFNYIVTPSERLLWQCRKKGFSESQVLPFGIPLRAEFSEKTNKARAKKLLGFYPDKPLITVMSGSMGYGSITRTVKDIDKVNKCFQMAVVCGNSEEELNKLKDTKLRHKTLKLGYTDKISLLMDASDCIITKPGGLSISESLSKGLPMILVNPIPGHEERNLTFLLNSGAAMAASENCPVPELVWQFFSEKKVRDNMSSAAKAIGKTDAANRLAEFIISKT